MLLACHDSELLLVDRLQRYDVVEFVMLQISQDTVMTLVGEQTHGFVMSIVDPKPRFARLWLR